MIVDTGATYHALADWLADELRVESVVSGQGHDHSGTGIPSRLARAVTVQSGDWTLLDRGDIVVVEVPAIFRTLNIGGFLSPQALAVAGSTVVMDHPNGTMSLLSDAAAQEQLMTLPLDLSGTTLRECSRREELPWRRFVVAARLGDHDVPLEIDTGAGHSEIVATNAAVAALRASAIDAGIAIGVSGATTSQQAIHARLRLGEVERESDIDLGRGSTSSPDCTFEGVVGMDVLRSCVLAMRVSGAAVRCGR
jgi:hypothetical protein